MNINNSQQEREWVDHVVKKRLSSSGPCTTSTSSKEQFTVAFSKLIWSLLAGKNNNDSVNIVKDDITSILPPFTWQPMSDLEQLAIRYTPYEKLLSMCRSHKTCDGALRIIMVAQWLLVTCLRDIPRKNSWRQSIPISSLLGEAFKCQWEHPPGLYLGKYSVTNCKCEKLNINKKFVSSIHWDNTVYGMSFDALLTSAYQLGLTYIDIYEQGERVLFMKDFNEKYYIKLPSVRYKLGVIDRTNSICLNGLLQITCPETGMTTNIRFDQPGDINAFKGKVECHTTDSKVPNATIAEISGNFASELAIISTSTLLPYDRYCINFDKEAKDYIPEIQCLPIDEQGSYESRRLWYDVFYALQAQDFSRAEYLKRKLKKDHENKEINNRNT